MELSNLNFLAILVATISSFAVGSVWYSPILFGNVWMKENGFTTEDLKNTNMVRLYSASFALAFVMAFNLAAFLGTDAGWIWGLTAGALAGIGWVAMAVGIIYLYEGKSIKLYFINAGYQAVTLTLMGAIIGAWQ